MTSTSSGTVQRHSLVTWISLLSGTLRAEPAGLTSLISPSCFPILSNPLAPLALPELRTPGYSESGYPSVVVGPFKQCQAGRQQRGYDSWNTSTQSSEPRGWTSPQEAHEE